MSADSSPPTLDLAARKALDMALDVADLGIWVLDIKSNIVSYDERLQRLFGFPAELTLEDGVKTVHPEDFPDVQMALTRAFDPNGDGLFKEDFRQMRSDGSVVWVMGSGAVTFEGEGEARAGVLFSGALQDIHERKLKELELDDLSQRLETLVRDRTQEVRTLAADLTLAEQVERQRLAKTLHDTVQQELYSVQFGLASVRNELEGRFADKLEESLDAVKRTVEITRDVTMDLRPMTLDELDLAASLRWLASSMAQKHGLEVNVEGIKPFIVKNEAMRSLLYNLASELLFNIVKHAGFKEATLVLDLRGEDLELSVHDKGAGFTPNLADNPSGTGHGLSGARKRLQLFGGELQIESELDLGTTITVLMPQASLV